MNWKTWYYKSHMSIRLYGYNKIHLYCRILLPAWLVTYVFPQNSLITVILSYKNLAVTSTLGTTNTEMHTGTKLSILTHMTRTFLNRSCPFSMGFFVCWCCCPSVGNHLHFYFVHQNYSANLFWNKHKAVK